jgi:hypothetical protein
VISWILRPSHRAAAAASARKKQRRCASLARHDARRLASRRAAMPYAQGFDPLLIVAQIGSMQALWYLTTN